MSQPFDWQKDAETARDLAALLESQLAAAEQVCLSAEAYLKAQSAQTLSNLAFDVLTWRLSR